MPASPTTIDAIRSAYAPPVSATATLIAPMAAKSPRAGSSSACPTATHAVTAADARIAVPSAPGSTVAVRINAPAGDTATVGFALARFGA
jgi:hypothetical protein